MKREEEEEEILYIVLKYRRNAEKMWREKMPDLPEQGV